MGPAPVPACPGDDKCDEPGPGAEPQGNLRSAATAPHPSYNVNSYVFLLNGSKENTQTSVRQNYTANEGEFLILSMSCLTKCEILELQLQNWLWLPLLALTGMTHSGWTQLPIFQLNYT